MATLKSSDTGAALYDTDAPCSSPRRSWCDPFVALRDVLNEFSMAIDTDTNKPDHKPAGLGFTAGWVGYLGYDLIRSIERIPTVAAVDMPLPDMHLQLCDHVLAYEHTQARWYFCTTLLTQSDPEARARVWQNTLSQVQSKALIHATKQSFKAGQVVHKTPNAQYLRQVQTILDFVQAGDILQANLSHRLESDFQGDSFALYQALTRANPAPYAAYLQGNGFAIASVSPEQFLNVRGRQVTTKPIKGTRLRSADVKQDQANRDALKASDKDRAENVMIVDLMRNDLGRVAKIGSVKVASLFDIEAHPSVWQMISTVTAELRTDADLVDVLRACWPPGSMTGAPKVHAMEIIDSLEPVRRGPYAGAIGYIGVSGDMDLSVIIRTAIVSQNRVMVQVGGAIVADSEPVSELDETYAKGRILFETLGWQQILK
jgi:para-aminobenzoate synthetase component 1